MSFISRNNFVTLEDVLYLNKLSEKIGKNSAKIMRLRTLIQQSKIV